MTAENQEKKAYLMQVQALSREIDVLQQEKSRWMALACQISVRYRETPGGGNAESKIQRALEKVDEIEQKIIERIDRLIEKREAIEQTIRQVEDGTLRELLRRRYLLCETWEEIADAMHYSFQWVCVLHGRALGQIKTVDSN